MGSTIKLVELKVCNFLLNFCSSLRSRLLHRRRPQRSTGARASSTSNNKYFQLISVYNRFNS